MKRWRMAIAGGLALTLAAPIAIAQRTRLDDSLSPVPTYPVELAWGPAEIRRALNALVAGTPNSMPPVSGRVANVEVRLDTRDFVGRAARIYVT
jgi:hypothetical protein